MNRIILFLGLIVPLLTYGQKVSFTLSAPKAVEMGQVFQITYTLNTEGRNFTGPNFTDFDNLGGPFPQTYNSMQIIGNKMTQSSSTSYTYQLRAKKTGTFTIPAATVMADGKKISSNSTKIEVVGGGQSQSQSQSQSQGQSHENPEQTSADGLIFGRIITSKKSLMVGEPVLVTIKIYSEKEILSITDYKEPKFEGFWKENFEMGQLSVDREAYGNKVYNVVTLQRLLLFPSTSGKLTLGGFNAKVNIGIIKTRKPRDQWEQMMYGPQIRYKEQVETDFNSPSVSIDVKPFPETGKPIGFEDITGEFRMKDTIDKTELSANDAITYKIRIDGVGNMNKVKINNPAFPTDFEVYDPKVTDNTELTANGLKGSKTFEYLIIPRNEGTFTIPSVEFSYFDLKKKEYITLKTAARQIKVGKSTGKNYTTYSPANQSKVKMLDNDIRYIKTDLMSWTKKGTHSFNSWVHLLLLLAAPILFIFGLWLNRKNTEKQQDVSGLKFKKANSVARKRLKLANKLRVSNQTKEFYLEISRAIWGYLSDKFNIPLSILSMETVQEKLNTRMDNESINLIVNVLNDCEFARFGPNAEKASEMERIYNSTLELISKIERN